MPPFQMLDTDSCSVLLPPRCKAHQPPEITKRLGRIRPVPLTPFPAPRPEQVRQAATTRRGRREQVRRRRGRDDLSAWGVHIEVGEERGVGQIVLCRGDGEEDVEELLLVVSRGALEIEDLA
jgi:hypothetical protein